MSKNTFDKFETQELTKPRDKAWGNFAKFEKEGDAAVGILRDVFYQPAEGQYPERRGFTLEQEDGELVNVAIKRNPYFAIRPTNDVKLGDLLTVKLSELRPSKTKGYNATKIFSFESGTLPENADNPTVRELEAKDMQEQGVAAGETNEENDQTGGEDDVPFN